VGSVRQASGLEYDAVRNPLACSEQEYIPRSGGDQRRSKSIGILLRIGFQADVVNSLSLGNVAQ
jgi:hypothetical protein